MRLKAIRAGRGRRPGGRRLFTGAVALLAACGVLGTVPSAVQASPLQAPTWTKQAPATHPPARHLAAMAYDAATGDVVLFGGATRKAQKGDLFGDTWTWDGSTWTKRAPAHHPAARYGAAMVYDAATGDVVLYGGRTFKHALGDTWIWNGSDWAKQSPAVHPSPTKFPAMAYDAATGDVVLFGGYVHSAATNATWTWNGSTWARQSPSTSPPTPSWSAMAYDQATGDVVLFATNVSVCSTWTWDGSNWTEQAPASSPPPRDEESMATDPATGQVMLFGGQSAVGVEPPLNDTWIWNGSDWVQQLPTSSPSARYGTSLAPDADGDIVLFSGINKLGNSMAGTWTWG